MKPTNQRFSLRMASAEKLDGKGKIWKVVIAEAGPTLNRIFIPPDVLEKNVALFEESRLMMIELEPGKPNHMPIRIAEQMDAVGGATGNFVGIVKNVKFVKDAGTHGLGELQAEAHLWSEPLRMMLLELHAMGILEKQLGLSFFVDLPKDGSGMSESDDPAKGDWILQSIEKVRSTDVVLEPAAGGKFKALAASIMNEHTQEVLKMKKILKHLKRFAPKATVAMSADGTPEQESVAKALDQAIVAMAFHRDTLQLLLAAKVALAAGEMDQVAAILDEAAKVLEAAIAADDEAKQTEMSKKAEADKAEADKGKKNEDEATQFSKEDVQKIVDQSVKEATEKIAMSAKIEQAISSASGLNEHSKAHARSVLMSAAKVTDEMIAETLRTIAKVQGVSDPEGKDSIQMAKVGETEKEKLYAAMSYLMDSHDEKKDLAWRPRRLSEVVSAFGFDQAGAGLRFDKNRLTPSLQMSVSSTDLTEALANSMNRRILKVAANTRQYWRSLVSQITNVPDFRSREIVRVDGLEDFTKKASETAEYDEVVVAPTDSKSSYSADEYGKKFTISRKVWINDDLGVVRKFVDAMTRSGLRTLDRFVLRLFIGDTPTAPAGPNTRDFDPGAPVVTLYHASRNNIITTAFGPDSISEFKRKLAKQTEYGQDALEMNLMLDTLVYPIELGPEASVLQESMQKPGGDLNDANIHRGIRNWIEVPTGLLGGDANNYYGMASPTEIDTIEVGFLNGQQTPFIFLQDVRTTEPMLLTGNMTAVGQFDFGAELLEPKAFVGAIVA